MARYKTIPSALHNFAHSFLSELNWTFTDNVVSHIGRTARRAGVERIVIEWYQGTDEAPVTVEPALIATSAVRASIARYRAYLPSLLRSMDSSLGLLHAVRMTLVFDWRPAPPECELSCTVEAEDDQGKNYEIAVAVPHPPAVAV